MDGQLVAVIAAAVVTGIFAIIARLIAPRVEKNAVVVDSALSMLKEYRDDNQRLKEENAQLRAEAEEHRSRDE